MISRARILEKNGPAILGGGDCRITCLARILKLDVRSKKSCDLRISSRAAAPEEYETAREAIGIVAGIFTCCASGYCRGASVARVLEGYGACVEGIDKRRASRARVGEHDTRPSPRSKVGAFAAVAWIPLPVIVKSEKDAGVKV